MQNLNELLHKIISSTKHLLNYYQAIPEPKLTHEKVIYAYQIKVMESLQLSLSIALSNPSTCYKVLSTFLEENWRFTKGTAVFYTALPQHEVTILLCDLAETLVKMPEKEKDFAIAHLMPGVALESLSDQYPDLTRLPVREILLTYIEGETSDYLIPLSLLCDLKYIENLEKGTAILNPYFDYRRHGEKSTLLNKRELDRLTRHSLIAQETQEQTIAYCTLLKDPSTLIGHLYSLLDALYKSSVNGFGAEEKAAFPIYSALVNFDMYLAQLGEAKQKQFPQEITKELSLLFEVSSGVAKNEDKVSAMCMATRYTTLQALVKKYKEVLTKIVVEEKEKNSLCESQYNRLKKNQHELLKRLKEKHYKGVDLLPLTCALLEKLKINFFLFSEVNLQEFLTFSSEDMAKLLESEVRRNQLLSFEIFKKIDAFISFCINTPFEKLNVLFEKIGLAFFSHILKCTEVSLSQAINILDEKKKNMIFDFILINARKLITDVALFGVIWRTLNESKKNQLLDQISPKDLFMLVKKSDDFRILYFSLFDREPETFKKITTQKWCDLIQERKDFSVILRLNPIFSHTVYEALGPQNIANLVETLSDCREIFSLLPHHVSMIFKALEGTLSKKMGAISFSCFKEIWVALSVDERDKFFALLTPPIFSKIITTFSNFVDLVPFLTPAQSSKAFDMLIFSQKELPAFIHTERHLIDFCSIFTSLQWAAVEKLDNSSSRLFEKFERLHLFEENIPGLSLILTDRVFQLLTAEKFAHRIQKIKDFIVLYKMNPLQRTKVIEIGFSRWPLLIETARQFVTVCSLLPSEGRVSLHDSLMKRFLKKPSDFIKNITDYKMLCSVLTVEQCRGVFQSLTVEGIAHLINTGEEYCQACQYLEPDQWYAIFNEIKNKPLTLKREDWDCLREKAPAECYEAFSKVFGREGIQNLKKTAELTNTQTGFFRKVVNLTPNALKKASFSQMPEPKH